MSSVNVRPWAVGFVAAVLMAPACCEAQDTEAAGLRRWLGSQQWVRDTDGPVVSLGEPGAFDDAHIFAPCVARDDGKFRLWYCGSRGAVGERVFRLGLASGPDGLTFEKSAANPVFGFADGKRSVLTPTLLRTTDGRPLREAGKLRMWFSATDFTDGTGLHTLHETRSVDGVAWDRPSAPLLRGVYAPSVLKEGAEYRMWYTALSANPWVIRHARSDDGVHWEVAPRPALVVDQEWEKDRLFYPAVVKAEGLYLMWYGSYWSAHRQKTAIGFAVSRDGLAWVKSPHNPVLRPDPDRPWESHYVTSQSALRLADGSWRIWYASRKRPPFRNKYFAIGTARWRGPTGRDSREGP